MPVSASSDRSLVLASPPPPRSRAALRAGLVAAVLVVSPPTEAWVHESLTAHMVQHTVLIGIVGPLVALGSPAPARHFGSGWLAAAVVAHTVVILGWHAPPLFDAAEQARALHILEHLCFFAAAWFLWWVAARAGGSTGWGSGGLAVFVSIFPLTVLGVGLMLSRTTWYEHHDELVDQQIGGAVMWGAAGSLAVTGAVALCVAWVGASGDVPQSSDPGAARAARPVNSGPSSLGS